MPEWFVGDKNIKKVEVKAIIENWICPKCNTGEMIFNGMIWPTGEPGYWHECNECKNILVITKYKFPILREE